MSPVVVYVLSALACVVVVLTRVRLGAEGSSGGKKSSPMALNVHSGAGVLAALTWTLFLFVGRVELGFVGLALWWVTALAGLALLLRWLPSQGRHADDEDEDEWAAGPGLSLLAHLGLLVGVLVFSFAFASSVI